MNELPYRLERTVTIRASRDTVFRYFTDSARWAAWWGAGSTIDARPGGPLYIRHPGGVESRGEVLDVRAPERIVFTYGFVTGTPIPPGASRVTIRLETVGDATRLHLEHEFGDEAVRDEHVQGWRYQLSVFSNVVADEVHKGAGAAVDGWFAAWGETDARKRADAFAPIVARDVRFRDRFSLIDGMDDLVAHVGAAQKFMPGVTLKRNGEIRQCQGVVLADWIWVKSGGEEYARGTNVFALRPDGLIESATGFVQTVNR
jgi:uncharacterized protein YndB with AHSA1/START domain